MSNSAIIKTTSLTYHYSGQVRTLSEINLHVERGSIYGFLGPNGSGKTTTLSLILGLLNNQQGGIEIFGQHLHSNRIGILKKVGSLIESPSLYGHLTARENLEVYRAVYGASKAKVDEVLDTVGLGDAGKKTVKKFSLGMKQRLSIALALLPTPELLILDEPANGLDPAGIIELRELIKKLNKEHGMTILISSHLLGEVEKMVSHVGIILKGKMIFQGSLPDLHLFQQKEEGALSVAFQDISQVAGINKMLTQHGLDVYLLHPKKMDLEQLFIDLTSTQS